MKSQRSSTQLNSAGIASQPTELVHGVDFVLDDMGQIRSGAGFGLCDEAGRMLQHQAVQRGLLGSVAIVVDRGAIRGPSGLPAELARSQAAPGAAIVPKCAHLRVPTVW